MTPDPLEAAAAPVRALLLGHLDPRSLQLVRRGRLPVQRAVDAVIGVLGDHSVNTCPTCAPVHARMVWLPPDQPAPAGPSTALEA